jgi:glycosyltransferase involved in cell wall biosynthesis
VRILLVTKFWRAAGGVEAHAFAVKDALESMGHEVVPYAMAEPDTLPSPAAPYFPTAVDFRGGALGDRVRSVTRAAFATGARKPFGRLLDDQRFDAAYVVHIYHQLGMPLLNVLRSAGVPTVLSLHDYKMICPNYRLFSERTGQICTRCYDNPRASAWAPVQEGCWGGSRSAGVALAVEAAAVRAQRSYHQPHVITTLNSLQEEALRRSGVDVPVRRLPHPVSLGDERPSEQRDHFLYVGRLVPEKGLGRLIPGVAAAGVSLRVVGDGRSRPELEALVRSSGASVEFVGSREPDQVRAEMREAIALVVPSVWHEVSPLVVYEAFSEDLPVVGTSVGGMVDQLDGGRGVLVPVDAPPDEWAGVLRRLADDQAWAQSLSARARAHVAAHQTPEQWRQGLVEVFRTAGVELMQS